MYGPLPNQCLSCWNFRWRYATIFPKPADTRSGSDGAVAKQPQIRPYRLCQDPHSPRFPLRRRRFCLGLPILRGCFFLLREPALKHLPRAL